MFNDTAHFVSRTWQQRSRKALAILTAVLMLAQSGYGLGPSIAKATGSSTPPLTTCTLYGYNDQDLDDSRLFQMNLQTGISSYIGSTATDEDLEAIDTQPSTGTIYGFPDNGSDDTSAVLVTVNRDTGARTFVANVSSDFELPGASFNPVTGELWASADTNDNLYTINLTTGVPTLMLDASKSGEPQALAWNNAGTLLYVAYDDDIYTTNGVAEVSKIATVNGEVEGMEFDENGNLIVGIHGNNSLFVFDTSTETLVDTGLDWPNDDVETLTTHCPPPTPPGSLTVVKVMDSGAAAPHEFGFRLDDNDPYVFPNQGEDSVVFDDLAPGTYTVAEQLIANYEQASTTCDDVVVASGQQASCEIHNRLVPTPVCELEIVKSHDKETANPGDTISYRLDFENVGTGNCTGGGVKVKDVLDGLLTYVADSEQHSANVSFGYGGTPGHVNGTLLWNADTLTPGESGWVSFEAAIDELEPCTDIRIPNQGMIWSKETGWIMSNTVWTTVTAHCPNSSLTIIKDVVNPFNFEPVKAFDFSLTGDATENFSLGDSEQEVFTDLDAGTYVVTETLDHRYATAVSCEPDARVSDGNGQATIELGTDEHVTCTFTNTRRQGEIVVHKDVDEDADGQVDATDPPGWTWDLMGRDGSNIAADIPMGETLVVPTGFYWVMEHQLPGYHAVEATCGEVSFGPQTQADGPVHDGEKLVCTFTNQRDTGVVHGAKYEDSNGNGQADPAEPGVNGWTIQLKQNGQVIMSTETAPSPQCSLVACPDLNHDLTIDAADVAAFSAAMAANDPSGDFNGDGNVDASDESILAGLLGTVDYHCECEQGWYEFRDILVGTYDICEVPQAGWVQTDPGGNACHSVEVQRSGSERHYLFGNFKLGELHGSKFVDRNGNGAWDEGEPSKPNWTIFLWNDAEGEPGEIIAQTQTDANGAYRFTDLPAGDYWVSEADLANWIHTSQPTLYGPLTVTSGTVIEGLDFGNFERGAIRGHKFERVGAGNLPLASWEIVLQKENALGQFEVVAQTTTAADGSYAFEGLTAGTYLVQEVIPVPEAFGWVQLEPTDKVFVVVVTSGDVHEDLDFVNQRNRPDLTITKDDGRVTANPGETLTYTIVVRNVGAHAVTGMTVVDTLPDHVMFVTHTAGVAVGQAGKTLTWQFPSTTLGPGESFSFTVTVAIPALMPFGLTRLHNEAVVSTTVPETDTTNNKDDDDTNVTAAPTIAIVKDGPATVNAGTSITYTIAWSVGGNAQATNATVTDALPPLTSFISASGNGTFANGVVSWLVGTVKPGDKGTVTLTVGTPADLTATTVITNVAVFDTTENTPVNEPAITNVLVPQVLPAVANPELAITKTVNKEFTNPGDTVEYTVIVKNVGAATAVNVTLTDSLPDGFTFVDGGDDVKTWSLGDLDPGQSFTVAYKVKVGAVKSGLYENFAAAKAENADEVSDEALVEVRGISVLATTGAGLLDDVLVALGALITIAGAALFLRQRSSIPILNI